MNFSAIFLNCGKRPTEKKPKSWPCIAKTLRQAMGDDPAIVGLCEVYDDAEPPAIVESLYEETGRKYSPLFTPLVPAAPRLGLLVDNRLGRIVPVGDDASYRHGKDWPRWWAGRVSFFRPGTRKPSSLQLTVVVNH